MEEEPKEELQKIKEVLKQAVSSINNEMEDHLDSINENTNEIQANYEYLCELDNKINKLNEKIEEIQIILSKLTGKKLDLQPDYTSIEPLTKQEQKIFLVVYTEERPISYMEISSKMNLPLTMVREYITSLIEKGVPIQKTYMKGRPFVLLEQSFKSLQAKQNVVKIDQRVLI
jgi:biotin operon repressor